MKTVPPPFPWLSVVAWSQANIREKALLWAAYEADVTKAREEGGNNRGPRIEEYQRFAHCYPGDPWCAAFVTWCYGKAGAMRFPAISAAVFGWVGSSLVEVVTKPQRGDLFFWLDVETKKGHIGFVSKVGLVFVETIEGNTNGGGSRDGDRVMRRRRLKASLRYLRWKE